MRIHTGWIATTVVIVAIACCGGCGSKVASAEETKWIAVRMALTLYPLLQGRLPEELEQSLTEAGVEIDGPVMMYSPGELVMSRSSTGAKVTPKQDKWCKIVSYIEGKGIEAIPDVELKGGGFGVDNGEFYVQDGTLVRLEGSVYRSSDGKWAVQKTE